MLLGSLIDTLKVFAENDSTMPVVFTGGTPVGALDSYRGFYDQLTLTDDLYTDHATTVGDMYADAVAADGATFTGWKGGEYIMGRHTIVHGERAGEAGGSRIGGMYIDGDRLVVTRVHL